MLALREPYRVLSKLDNTRCFKHQHHRGILFTRPILLCCSFYSSTPWSFLAILFYFSYTYIYFPLVYYSCVISFFFSFSFSISSLVFIYIHLKFPSFFPILVFIYIAYTFFSISFVSPSIWTRPVLDCGRRRSSHHFIVKRGLKRGGGDSLRGDCVMAAIFYTDKRRSSLFVCGSLLRFICYTCIRTLWVGPSFIYIYIYTFFSWLYIYYSYPLFYSFLFRSFIYSLFLFIFPSRSLLYILFLLYERFKGKKNSFFSLSGAQYSLHIASGGVVVFWWWRFWWPWWWCCWWHTRGQRHSVFVDIYIFL